MIRGVRHTGIVVRDLAKAVRFYSEFGFAEYARNIEPSPFIDKLLGFNVGSLTTVKMRAGDGTAIEFLCFEGDSADDEAKQQSLRELGITHLALNVVGIDELYEKWSRLGLRFCSAPMLSPDGRVKVVFCTDPNGVWLELVEVLNP